MPEWMQSLVMGWPMISANLPTFFAVVAIILVVTWAAMSWFYEKIIAAKNAQIEMLDRQGKIHTQPKLTEQTTPFNSNDSPNAKPLVVVGGKYFVNERILLDGFSYTHCNFRNVTLVYNGGPMSMTNNTFEGFTLTSDCSAIQAAMRLMFNMGLIKLPGLTEHGPITPTNPFDFK